jgi:hypothetical protein
MEMVFVICEVRTEILYTWCGSKVGYHKTTNNYLKRHVYEIIKTF